MVVLRLFALTLAGLLAPPAMAESGNFTPQKNALCQALGERLARFDAGHCRQLRYQHSVDQAWSAQRRPLLEKGYLPKPRKKPLGRIMIIGGTHGDELTATTLAFEWMKLLDKHHSGLFHWRVLPCLNPDGVLKPRPTRTNGRGVDLNRNMPTPHWDEEAPKHWARRGLSERRFPGENPGSEPETRWLMQQIKLFKPDIIISIHAPLNGVDFDGPFNPPNKLGGLPLNLLGTYPGSLGNYAGVQLGIPVITVELKNARKMPSNKQVRAMWNDLIDWLVALRKKQKRLASKK